MDLFQKYADKGHNYLSHQGEAFYFGQIFSQAESNKYYQHLMEGIEWQNDAVIIYGKKVTTKRKVAWYGDKAFGYRYSNVTKIALPWSPVLKLLKNAVELESGESFNSCLLNLYHDGSEGMGWHSDNEKELKKHAAIASLSFGAERRFSFKHRKTNERVALYLEHGSLLIMKGETQENWLHSLPPIKSVCSPRINLTFRTIAMN